MRSVLLVLAAVGLMAETPPASTSPQTTASPAQLQEFEHALAGYQFSQAAGILDRLIVERTPADGKPRPDPLLNALFGRFYLAARETGAAGAFLDHAPIAELPAELRARTALDHARALDLRGDRLSSLQAYREAAVAAVSDAERRDATLGIARQSLADNPAAVRPDLMAIARGPSTPARWQANYLLAITSSLTGDQASAAQFADRAWQDALGAPLSDLAALHVATLRAGLAAARHDRATERTMLIATNGLSLSASNWLPSQLPVCGDHGITPDDYVIFGFTSGPYSTQDLIPIAASRPAAVAPFLDSLAGISPIKGADGYKPVGTVFTVSCRTDVDYDYTSRRPTFDPMVDWIVEHGLYPASASNETEDQHLALVGHRIEALSARFGATSPLLIAPRWQMMTLLEARASAGDAVLPGQLTDLSKQIASGMTQAGAPAWLARTVEARSAYEQVNGMPADDPGRIPALQNVLRNFLLHAPIDVARDMLAVGRSNFRDDWPPQFSQLVVDLNAGAASLTGRDRQAWMLLLAEAHRQLGQARESKAIIAAAGVSPDLCIANDEAPALLEQHFTYKDYPGDLIAGDQEGAVMFEFGLAPSGNIAAQRIVYSIPSGLFDEPSAKGIATVRYSAPKRNGRPVTCRGIHQPIIWRLEGEHDFSLPRLAPDIADKVS